MDRRANQQRAIQANWTKGQTITADTGSREMRARALLREDAIQKAREFFDQRGEDRWHYSDTTAHAIASALAAPQPEREPDEKTISDMADCLMRTFNTVTREEVIAAYKVAIRALAPESREGKDARLRAALEFCVGYLEDSFVGTPQGEPKWLKRYRAMLSALSRGGDEHER